MINKKLLLFAIILSLLTAGSLYYYLENLEKNIDNTEYIEVFAAAKNISADTKISKEMFQSKEIPTKYVHASTVADLENVLGKVLKVPLAAGEVILENHVAEEEGGDGLAYTIPEGKRAVAVAVNEISAVANMVLPGDKIDLIATLDLTEKKLDGSEENITQSSFLLQDIEILAVGRNMKRSNGMTTEVSTVTLAVEPQDAPKLVLATERGSIRMLLRSPVDGQVKDSSAIRLQDLLESR